MKIQITEGNEDWLRKKNEKSEKDEKNEKSEKDEKKTSAEVVAARYLDKSHHT